MDERAHRDAVPIDAALVQRLVAAQFPRWADLEVRTLTPGGWDNRSFRLGDHMLVRLPSAEPYAAQVHKEQTWLPRLAPALPLPIPRPLAFGGPALGYPWTWSIYTWIDGEPATHGNTLDLGALATQLARFLVALQGIETAGGPPPGPHNFERGGSLLAYDEQIREALARLAGRVDTAAATALWRHATATRWQRAPVWLHGDVAPGNLLVRDGRLVAVIDFGQLAVGDPACDLAIAWAFFDAPSRARFRAELALDADTWTRGRAWALWKASILACSLVEGPAADAAQARQVIDEVLGDAPY